MLQMQGRRNIELKILNYQLAISDESLTEI